MNKVEVIKLNDNYISVINSLSIGEYFILTNDKNKLIEINLLNYQIKNDITVFNVLDTEGYIYKKNIKNIQFNNFKDFISSYNNITGIIFKKVKNINTLEELYSNDYILENNITLTVDDFYKVNEQTISSNLTLESQKIIKYDEMVYDFKSIDNFSENFIKLYKKYYYCDLIQGIIDLLNKKKEYNTYIKLQQKYASSYTFLELYQIYEKMYYIDEIKDVLTW